MSSPKPSLDALRIERRPEQPSGFKPWMLIVAAVVLLALGAGLWWHSRSAAMVIHTAIAQEATTGGDDRTVLNASGYVTARREATVSSKVTGKVTSILIEEGMRVTNGQVLATLDDSNIRTDLEVAKAQLISAEAAVDETRAQLKQASNEYQRTIELAKSKIDSQSDLDQAEASAKGLQAHLDWQQTQIDVAQREVDQYQQNLDDTIIRSPFDGVITTKDAQPGEMISPEASSGFTRTGIGTVVDMKSLEIDIDVNENYINRVTAGQPVVATLDAYPDWKIPCKVIAIVPTADRDKSTVKVRVSFDQLDPRILPDMSAKVAFQEAGNAQASRMVLVPKTAVQEQDGHDIIFVVVSDGRAERRAVTVTDTQNDDSIINAGVSGGEHVIVNAPADLKDGMAVKEENP